MVKPLNTIKVKAGRYKFTIPLDHEAVTREAWEQIFKERPESLNDITRALCRVPEKIKLSESSLFRLYQLTEHLLDAPELIRQKMDIDAKAMLLSDSFVKFEQGRGLIAHYQKHPGLTLYGLAKIYDLHYDSPLEAGMKIYEAYGAIFDAYSVYYAFQGREANDTEQAAGIDRIQSFGIYPTLSKIAEKYSRLPGEIEQQPAGFVLKEWAYMEEVQIFVSEYQKLTKK